MEIALEKKHAAEDNAMDVDQLRTQVGFFHPQVGQALNKIQAESWKKKFEELNKRVQQQLFRSNQDILRLKNEAATLTKERNALQAQTPTVSQESAKSKAFLDRIAVLEQEKSSLEVSLNEVRAKATELSNQTATLVGE